MLWPEENAPTEKTAALLEISECRCNATNKVHWCMTVQHLRQQGCKNSTHYVTKPIIETACQEVGRKC